MSLLGDMFTRGTMGMAGFEPAEHSNLLPGRNPQLVGYRGFGDVMLNPGRGTYSANNFQWMSGSTALGAANIGFTAFGALTGFATGGFGGAYDALVLDFAANQAVSTPGVGYVSKTQYTSAGRSKVFERSGTMRRLGGSFVAGSIGQAVGSATGIPMMGTIGAFAGSSLGAAPMRNAAAGMRLAAAHPLMAGGALAGAAAVGGAYTVARAGGTMVKSAAQYAKARRRMDTDGSLAAFNTQGAYTMRARAVQALQKTHMNARQSLGREANLLHQGATRNYHSRYR